MANLDDDRTEGQTLFGTDRAVGVSGGIGAHSPTVHDQPSYLTLESTTAGGVKTAYYLWFDSTGVLRRGTTRPGSSGFDQDSSGSAV